MAVFERAPEGDNRPSQTPAEQLREALNALEFERAARIEAEQRLLEVERSYRLALDALPNSFWLKDADSRYRIVNATFCRFHNITREDAIGKRVDDFAAPGLAEGVRLGDLAAIQSGQLHRSEVRVLDASGAVVWIETIKQVILNDDGSLFGLIGMTRTTTERRLAEEALRASEARYRLLVDSLPEIAVLLLDETLCCLISGGPALADLQLTPDGLNGQPLRELLPAQIANSILPLAEMALAGSSAGTTCAYLDRIYRVQAAPLARERIAMPYVLLVLQDITARTHAEEARRQMERTLQESQHRESLGVLAGGIAHDFNNLLTSILGHAELARLDSNGEQPLSENLDQIVAGTQYAARLARQLLAYAGKGRFLIQPIDLNQLIDGMSELIRVSLPRSVSVQIDQQPNLPLVEGDSAQIQQVVLNLLTNAAEALDGSGLVMVSTRLEELRGNQLAAISLGSELPDGLYVRLEVRDNGVGMDPATIVQIFDPFFSTKRPGRGLGLAAVQGIVRSHHGALHVSSAPGQGTTFRIWLPTTQIEPVEREPPPLEAPLYRGTVLLIDDEPAVRAVTSQLLTRLGFTVQEAPDGETALSMLWNGIDALVAVLLDLVMPGIGGAMTARIIQAEYPSVPLIVMSGYYSDQSKNAMDLPATAFIHKPFGIDTLRSALAVATRRSARPRAPSAGSDMTGSS